MSNRLISPSIPQISDRLNPYVVQVVNMALVLSGKGDATLTYGIQSGAAHRTPEGAWQNPTVGAYNETGLLMCEPLRIYSFRS